MKLLSKSYNIKANIEHVFYCFSDNDYIVKEISRLNKHDEVHVIKSNEDLEFKGKSTLFVLSQIETDKPKYYKAKITTVDKNLLRFGDAFIVCEFIENNGETNVKVEINSEKNPSILWWILIKIMLFIFKLQSRKDEKLYIKAIEQNT